MARCILEEDLPSVIIAGSTESELCPYLYESEKEAIREILTSEEYGIKCFGLRSDSSVTEAVQLFLDCDEKKVFMMFASTTEGMDAFKDVKHMFMIGRNGMLRDRDGPSKYAKVWYEEWMCAVADEKSTMRRIRRAGSTKKPVTYWTFTGAEGTDKAPAPSAAATPSPSPSPSPLPADAPGKIAISPPPPQYSTGGAAPASNYGKKRRKAKTKYLTHRKTKTSKARRSGGAAGGWGGGGTALEPRRTSKRGRGAVELPSGGRSSKSARHDDHSAFSIRVSDNKTNIKIKGDASLTFKDLVETVAAEFRMKGVQCALSYKDDDEERIEIRTGKGWEECIRTRTGDRIRLSVQFVESVESEDEEEDC